MMVAKGAPIFLDTNIFLRYNIVEMPEHSAVSTAVKHLIDGGHLLWISRQVMHEFSVVLTHPQTFLKPFTSAEVAARLKLLLPLFPVADETAQVAAILLTLME